MKRYTLIILIFLLLAGCQTEDSALKKQQNNVPLIEDNYKEVLIDVTEVFNKAASISNIRNLSIWQNGQEVRTEYYNLCKENSKNNIYSDTKSISSLLIGIAIDQGYINSTEDFLSDYLDLSVYDVEESVYDITLHHLLTMGVGLDWNSSNLGEEYFALKNSEEPLAFILERDVTFLPGEAYNYSDGTAYLVSEVLYQATGMSPLDYANDVLFGPLGIEDVRWTQHKEGVNYGGFDLHLSANDMQKIGQMVLNQGLYKNRQIVSSEWIALSTSNIVKSPSTSMHKQSYGYFWWVGKKYGLEMFEAVGHGGQFIFIVPERSLVITSSAIGAVENSKAYQSFNDIEVLIVDELIPLFK